MVSCVGILDMKAWLLCCNEEGVAQCCRHARYTEVHSALQPAGEAARLYLAHKALDSLVQLSIILAFGQFASIIRKKLMTQKKIVSTLHIVTLK